MNRQWTGMACWGVLLVCFFCAYCGNGPASEPTDRFDKGTIYISCDESFKPVIDAEVEVYEASFPETHIVVQYKPEAECLKDYSVDSIRMIIATRGFSKEEADILIRNVGIGPKQATIAYDAIAVIVHPQATDSFFTMQQIRNLVSGKTNKNLFPVFDGVRATSTVRFMVDSVLNGAALGSNVVAAKSSEGVIDYVSKTKNAVGFVGVSWVGNQEDTLQQGFLKKVRIARVESTDSAHAFVKPVQYLIYTKSYPMIRNLVYVLKEKHLGLGQAFATFLKGERGQLIFRRAYLQPAIRPFYVRQAELEEDF